MRDRSVDEAVNPYPSVKKSPDESILQLGGSRIGEFRMHIVCAEPSAVCAQCPGILRLWRSAHDYGIRLVADIEQPDKFGSICPLVQNGFIRHNCQAAVKKWLHGVRPCREGRREPESADQLGLKLFSASDANS